MKAFLLSLFLVIQGNNLFSSENEKYPEEPFYGGGVGYTTTWLSIKLSQSFSELGSSSGMNMDISNWDGLFFMNGVEGYGHITGRWRIGASIAVGEKTASKLDTSTNWTGQARISLFFAGSTFEYVVPLFDNLEISTGSMVGLGRASLQIHQDLGTMRFSEIYDRLDEQTTSTFSGSTVTGIYVALEPYIATKYQFLPRAGIRASIGYTLFKISSGKWKINGYKPIPDSPEIKFNSPTIKITLFLGV
jgi:hypothetical protein